MAGGQDVTVVDQKTGEDITNPTLVQVLQEAVKGGNEPHPPPGPHSPRPARRGPGLGLGELAGAARGGRPRPRGGREDRDGPDRPRAADPRRGGEPAPGPRPDGAPARRRGAVRRRDPPARARRARRGRGRALARGASGSALGVRELPREPRAAAGEASERENSPRRDRRGSEEGRSHGSKEEDRPPRADAAVRGPAGGDSPDEDLGRHARGARERGGDRREAGARPRQEERPRHPQGRRHADGVAQPGRAGAAPGDEAARGAGPLATGPGEEGAPRDGPDGRRGRPGRARGPEHPEPTRGPRAHPPRRGAVAQDRRVPPRPGPHDAAPARLPSESRRGVPGLARDPCLA